MGIEIDRFYDQIDIENFQSTEEMLKFVESNSKFLTLKINSDGDSIIKPTASSYIERYIANIDGYYYIGETLYKVLDDGIISSNKLSENEMNVFNSIYDISDSDTDPSIFKGITRMNTQAIGSVCPLSDSDWGIDNKERVIVGYYYGCYPTNEGLDLTFDFEFSIKPQKKTLGIWWNVKRDIEYDIDIILGYAEKESDEYWSIKNWDTGATPVLNVKNWVWKRTWTTDLWSSDLTTEIGSTDRKILFGISSGMQTECNDDVYFSCGDYEVKMTLNPDSKFER